MSSSIASGDANILIKKLFFDKEESTLKRADANHSFFFGSKKEPKNYHFFCQKKWTKKQLRLEFENGLVKTMNINKIFKHLYAEIIR